LALTGYEPVAAQAPLMAENTAGRLRKQFRHGEFAQTNGIAAERARPTGKQAAEHSQPPPAVRCAEFGMASQLTAMGASVGTGTGASLSFPEMVLGSRRGTEESVGTMGSELHWSLPGPLDSRPAMARLGC
jgi:hypothetical protein